MVARSSFLSREGSWSRAVSWVSTSREGLRCGVPGWGVIRGASLFRAARASSLPLLMPVSSMSFMSSGMRSSVTMD